MRISPICGLCTAPADVLHHAFNCAVEGIQGPVNDENASLEKMRRVRDRRLDKGADLVVSGTLPVKSKYPMQLSFNLKSRALHVLLAKFRGRIIENAGRQYLDDGRI